MHLSAASLFDALARESGDEALTNLGLEVAAWPGDERPSLEPGDMLLRRALGEGRLAFLVEVASSEALAREALEACGVTCESGSGGLFVEVAGDGAADRVRRAWRLTGRDGRIGADTLILRPAPAEARSWANEKAWVRSKLEERDFGAVARWLNGQSKAVIETHFLSRMPLKTVARLHLAARREVGPKSQFARITRYRFLVFRLRWAVRKKKWRKAARWLNGFSPAGIRSQLARFPVTVIGELRQAALAEVGPDSNAARMTDRTEPYPAFFEPRKARAARGGSRLLEGWNQERRPTDWIGREDAIVAELLAGNVPGWLRHWVPIPVQHTTSRGRTIKGRVFVLPDYLAVGSDTDYVHVPLDKFSAQRVASAFGAMLPTARICHAVYVEAKRKRQHLVASTRDYWDHSGRRKAPRGRASTSSAAYLEHSKHIQRLMERKSIRPGMLVAGHKKDVIIANALHANMRWKEIAYHGFYNAQGIPFEPCYHTRTGALRPDCKPDTATLAHAQADGRFSDYSQGVRLVHGWMEVEGKAVPLRKVLAKKRLSKLVSAESTIVPARIPAPPQRPRRR